MEEILDKVKFNEIIESTPMVLTYFSHDTCNVCKVLKPKVEELLKKQFPKIKQLYCNVQTSPEIAASQTVFAVPTLLVWIEGRETYRLSRNIGLLELEETLKRPYNLLFE